MLISETFFSDNPLEDNVAGANYKIIFVIFCYNNKKKIYQMYLFLFNI